MNNIWEKAVFVFFVLTLALLAIFFIVAGVEHERKIQEMKQYIVIEQVEIFDLNKENAQQEINAWLEKHADSITTTETGNGKFVAKYKVTKRRKEN